MRALRRLLFALTLSFLSEIIFGMKGKFRVSTLGCRTNQYESQAFKDQLRQMGFEEAGVGEEAQLCLVNTCVVTEAAEKSSLYEVRKLRRDHPGAKVVVTGCLVEKKGLKLEEVKGASLIASNLTKEQLIADLFPEEKAPEFIIQNFDAHTRAFVKVQDGCNSFCSYCIIPYTRGRSRSRTIEEVVSEVEGLIAVGYQEIVLTGINIGDFDGGGGKTLADLVRRVDGIDGLKRLRLSSIDPDEVDDHLIAAILEGKHTCRSLHIVLQAGSNVTLKKMNRKYTKPIFLRTIDRLKSHDPSFTFTTDVIVGFPGETAAHFEETLDVMREVKFAKVHMFPYSRRERTRAALFDGHLSPEAMAERKARLLHLAEQMAFELRQPFVGRPMTVLTEEIDPRRPDMIHGHTDNFLQVWMPRAGKTTNALYDVTPTANCPEGLLV